MKPKTLNAIAPCQPPEAAERTARHLRICAELADLAMRLARAAAARTLADWAEPEAPPSAEPPLANAAESPMAKTAEPPANPAAAPRRSTATASHKPTDPAVLFTRLAATVRDCIALEARLSAGIGAAVAPRTRTLRADPRRTPVREAIGASLGNHPDRAEFLREATTRLDEHIAADPGQAIDGADLLVDLCEELGIEINLARLPDKYLFALTRTIDDDEAPPTPRATSPP